MLQLQINSEQMNCFCYVWNKPFLKVTSQNKMFFLYVSYYDILIKKFKYPQSMLVHN